MAADNRISWSMAYRYVHADIDVLAAAVWGLRRALLAVRAPAERGAALYTSGSGL